MVRTEISEYKGFICISSDFNADGLINNPRAAGQLGFVVNIDYIDISREAYELLFNLNKVDGGFADVMCWQTVHPKHGTVDCFAWSGGQKRLIYTKNAYGDAKYNPPLLFRQIKPVEAPDDFKVAADKFLAGQKARIDSEDNSK